MNIIYCLKGDQYLCFVEYIASISKLIKFKLILYNKDEPIYIINPTYNYIFMQDLPKNIKISNTNSNSNSNNLDHYKFFIINTEQLSFPNHSKRMNNYSSKISIIDYNISNLKYYANKNVYFLPYQINSKEIFNFKKPKNICIMYSTSEHRMNIVNILNSRGYNIDIIKGFGAKRDYDLFKYKILINISHNPKYNILETMRCDRCIYNKMIVISDYKEDMNEYYLKDHIIFVPYNKIVEKVIEVLNNYHFYYNTLFNNFEYDKINKKILDLSKNAVEILQQS